MLANGRQHEFQLDGHTIVALAYNAGQDKTPVIFLHGITASVSMWEVGQIPLLADYPWYSLSLPGHYPASFPGGFQTAELTPELITRLLSEAIRQLTGGQPAILVGHSTGGFAALAVAATAPALVKGVCSIAGFAHGRWTGALGLLQMLSRSGAAGRSLFKLNMRILTRSQWVYRQALGLYAHDRQAIYKHPALGPFLALNYPATQQLDIDAMLHWFQRMPDVDISAWLPQIDAPTLALFGDHDPIVPPAQGHLIAGRVPGSEKQVFAGVGHLPTSERTAVYHAVMTDWLQQIA
ncbi:MAG: alpha/beta hydrolase [Anaerolinea sp.]|nr:alpha/beta hydrolase [Anaerolinea sp.]